MAEEIYRLSKVSYTYEKQASLTDISFSAKEGETVTLLGANGSGKTTLLKILGGLLFPGSGKVTVFGREITEALLEGERAASFRRQVGFLFQEPDTQLFCPTVLDEIAFGPLQMEISSDEARSRTEELLTMLGIGSLRDRAPYTLSCGEKKQVAIASVLALNPKLLLLDEPTGGLDPRSQVWLEELITALKREKKSFLIATHDLSLAEDLSDRIVLMDEEHRIIADGAASDILRDKELLLRANLIHEHRHRHGNTEHSHAHGPGAGHDEHE